ncbi:alpha/beta fold hydrolase [Enterovirga rhinocerotis]|uniref:3-oxoadipate enol-lactonase n=1 Tax=Enterovirga rhinocerotis TaxID=1339210 RepID=A0A4R7C1U7_9HYPH|nr:alpha/beta hydrolase [Enterovirga rhinocerotis]TDR90376.1 3-oxoadipate enol-lactonase [Enterovirga rhinocerotis]
MSVDWIELDGAGFRHELTGGGERSIVLVHEMGGTLESWDLVLPLLGAGRAILRFDTRGAGQSTKLRGTAPFDRMADDVVALMDANGLRGPAVVVGCAVGGALALHAAARHPDRFDGVVALGPATGIAEERRPAILAYADRVEREGMLAVSEDELPRSYPEVLRADAERFRRFRARWLANDPGSYAAIYRMLAGIEMRAELEQLSLPSLFLAGRHDPLRPPEMIEPIARLVRGSRFEAVESGHFSATQTPDIVAGAIRAFVETLDGAA